MYYDDVRDWRWRQRRRHTIKNVHVMWKFPSFRHLLVPCFFAHTHTHRHHKRTLVSLSSIVVGLVCVKRATMTLNFHSFSLVGVCGEIWPRTERKYLFFRCLFLLLYFKERARPLIGWYSTTDKLFSMTLLSPPTNIILNKWWCKRVKWHWKCTLHN